MWQPPASRGTPDPVVKNLEEIWYREHGSPVESLQSYTAFEHDIRRWCTARDQLTDDQRSQFDGLSFSWRSTGDELLRCVQAL